MCSGLWGSEQARSLPLSRFALHYQMYFCGNSLPCYITVRPHGKMQGGIFSITLPYGFIAICWLDYFKLHYLAVTL